MLETEILVVGAGPAGTAAAITAARAGRDVLVVDRAPFPRDKCCGDGLTALALRELESLGLDPSTVADWTSVDDVVVTSPSGRAVTFPLPRGEGLFSVTAPRLALDAALVDVARAAGAKVADGHGLEALRREADHVVAGIAGLGPVAARYVIAADGMWSPTRKLTGAVHATGYRGEWHAFRQYARGIDGPARDRMLIWFEADLVPGYVWSFPLPGGRANVGFGIRRGERVAVGDMKALWPALLARPHIAAALGPGVELEGRHAAWPIPARVDEATRSTWGGRVLFAGDAAAVVDPMSGEGIGQAVLTGRLAAEAATAAGPHDAAGAAGRYEQAAVAHLLADHRMSELLVRALRHRTGARAAVAVAGLTPWTRRNFARWLFEDYPRAVIATPRRWHRGMFTSPGAYRR